MARETQTVATPYGQVPVKVCRYGDIVKTHPEFDVVCSLAASAGVPVTEVLNQVNLNIKL